MKRRVLCVFSFLLILLVFLTLISPKAEEEMRTLVDARKSGKGNGNLVIGNISILWRESDDMLFSVVEGSGWESGDRLAEIPSEYYDRYPGHVELGRGTEYRYVYSASREPVLGDAVRVVETELGEDTYLIWSPEPLSVTFLYYLPRSMSLASMEANAALIEARSATFPFFEHSVWFTLQGGIGSEWQESRETLRIYSMHDVEQMTRMLPWVAGVAALLLCSLLLCAASWILSRRRGCTVKMLAVNVLLIALLLAAVPLLLCAIDLPASLMPEESILDVGHYAEEFTRISEAMEAMGDTRVREWQSAATLGAALVLGLSVASIGALIAVEGVLCYRRTRAARIGGANERYESKI